MISPKTRLGGVAGGWWCSYLATIGSISNAASCSGVARELGVRYVLEGSVKKSGNRVRIAGQLIDTTTGAHVWAERFAGTLDDVFAMLRRRRGSR